MASSPEWLRDVLSEFQASAIVDEEPTYAELCDDKDYWVIDLVLTVPLDRRITGGKKIEIHASVIYGKKSPRSRPPKDTEAWEHYRTHQKNKPFLAYLCGGPGDGNTYTKTPAVNKYAIERGYQVLHLDYRGTGKFPAQSLVDADGMNALQLADYLAYFTQDKIAQDLEFVRLWLSYHLGWKNLKFTLLAQSFGGWVAMTYLSHFPTSIKEILLTAAMPPFTKTPHEAYQSLYRRVINRNEKYYALYPQDGPLVRKVVLQLFTNAHKQKKSGTTLNDGRRFGYDTLMTLGRLFGGSGRGSFDKVHNFLVQLSNDLDTLDAAGFTGPIPEETLAQFASKELESFRLHQRPLYGLLHEAIYCFAPGVESNWAAKTVGVNIGGHPESTTSPCPGSFNWLASDPCCKSSFEFMKEFLSPNSKFKNSKLYFTGEMIQPFMFEGRDLAAAKLLANNTTWEHLYHREGIRRNPHKVPVKSVVYKGDMYVDWEVSLEMGELIGGPCEVYLVSPGGDVQVAVANGRRQDITVDADDRQMNGLWEWTHGAVKQNGKTEEVLGLLFDGLHAVGGSSNGLKVVESNGRPGRVLRPRR